MSHRFKHIPPRPPWWPENEDWPPVRGRMRHNPFFRRLGCTFAFINFLGFAVFFAAAAFITNLFGLTRLSPSVLSWMLPLGIGLLVIVMAFVGLAVFGLRRVFVPLDELLEAAGRVAEGDYSIRVREKGPAEVRSLAKAFNNMASRLHLTDEKRRNLLADVTHELRTPLTVIQGNLEGMLDGIYPADETNLRSLLDETNILARLVEDLRTLALAESGALLLKKEPTDLAALIRDVVAAFQAQAEAEHIALTVEISENIPWLTIDPGRIRQVLTNLLANGLRYTAHAGSVCIRYKLDEPRAVIEVRDTGVGIAPEDLPHVFERFYKSTDSGGMGLGLAIAKHLVTAHEGTITAESTSGQGTTIRISLPLDK